MLPEVEGPTHRYMESSPACWALYGEVLAREYSDPAYLAIHRLTVDAYAAQHPGRPSPQSFQSVAVHLGRLCLLLERGIDFRRANDAMLALVRNESQFRWLTPPKNPGAMTVADVHRADSASAHVNQVRLWADSVWEAWSPHHATIRSWLPPSLRGPESGRA